MILTLIGCVTPGSVIDSVGGAADDTSASAVAPCLEPDNEQSDLYDETWALMDAGYPYFEYKGIDWAELGTHCRDQLMCGENPDYDHLMDEGLDCLLAPLSDRHTEVIDREGGFHSYGCEDLEVTADDVTIEGRLDPGSGVSTAFTRTGTLDGGRYGYVGVTSWASDALDNVDVASLLDECGAVDGVVIDMRRNGGGSPYIAQRLAGRFIDDIVTPYAFLQVRRERDGNAATHELGPALAETMNWQNVVGDIFAGRVAVLVGPACRSACETFVSMLVTLSPNVRTFGARTAGSDSRYTTQLLADGETTLYFSSTAVVAANKSTFIEWVGFEPNELVPFHGDGTDEVIDAAVEWLATP